MTQQTSSPYLILGAGQLGLALMDELTAQGHAVTLVNRSGKVGEPLPATATVVAGDVTDAANVARLCAGAEVVFLTSQPPYTQWPAQWPPMMRAILDGVARTQAKLVFGDNLYLYGPTGGAPIHEGLPSAARTRKGSTRAHIAHLLLEAHHAGKLQATIGRAADFYGPRVTGSVLGEGFFRAALTGKTVDLLGNPDLPHTYSYIRDFARALITLSQHEAALGQAWHIPNAETITTRQLVKLVEDEIGQSIRIRAANRWVIRAVGLFNPMVREFVELAYEFEEPYIVEHKKFAAAFGAQPTPHRVAIGETVAWYRGQQINQSPQ
jgi:nucleoside-diphosphate-sugar epimerase